MKFMQELSVKNTPSNTGLLRELSESVLIRTTSHLHQFTARDIADFTFLYFLALMVLREDSHQTAFVQGYANTTLRWGNRFDRFFSAGNDLYVLLHICEGHSREHLSHPKDAEAFFRHFRVDPHQTVWMLRQLGNGSRSASTETRFLSQLERELKVASPILKSCRRFVVSWSTAEFEDQRLTLDRLLQAFRTRMPRSELLGPLQAMSDRHTAAHHAAPKPVPVFKEPNFLTALGAKGATK